MADDNDPPNGKDAADIRVHLTTGHRTVGDALFALADTAKRAAPVAAPVVRRVWRVLLGLIAVVVTLAVVLIGGLLLYEHRERQEREAREEQEAAEQAATERAAEARAVKQRRAVLDLLEPGLVPMLCPVAGEVIGRQIVMTRPQQVRSQMESCSPLFGQDCSKAYSHDCTPATEIETAAWDRATSSVPPEKKQAVGRRAVVGADANPRIAVLDTETGGLYDIGRAELASALRANPSYTPATPAQVAAWRSVE